MSKITLTNLVNLENQTSAVNAINNNNAAITTAVENTLSRNGTSPNTMGSGLDMNSYRILNLPLPISGQEPLRLQDINLIPGGGSVNISPLPTGGTANQVLSKNTSTNYDVSWKSKPFFYATDYGVVADGVTDNTTFFANAISACPTSGCTLILPAGIMIGTMNINKPIILQGQGMGRIGVTTGNAPTEIRSNGASDNIINFTANGGGVRDLFISSSVAVGSRTGAGLKIGIVQGVEVRNVVSNGHLYGFWNTSAGNTFTQCYGSLNKTGFYLDGTSASLDETEVLDCQFNSNTINGVSIAGTGIGLFFKRLTAASNTFNGVILQSGSTISDLFLLQPEISENGASGIDTTLNTGINLIVSGGLVEVLNGTGNAITLGANQGNSIIIGCNISGSTSGAVAVNIAGPHTAITGCQIVGGYAGGFTINFAGTSTYFLCNSNVIQRGSLGSGILIGLGAASGTVSNNVFAGFPVGNSLVDLSTATTIQILNNNGYNPVGVTSAATIGASPATITAGHSRETHYVRQSATNTATITQGGQAIATLANSSTYYPIQLEPNDSYVVTWATTAPTYTKYVH